MDEASAESKQNPKDAHLSALSDELAQHEREKDRLVSSPEENGGASRAELAEDLRRLDRSLEDARSALREAQTSPAKRWVQAKAKADDAFQALRDALHGLKSP